MSKSSQSFPTEELMDALLKDPEKRAIVLQLINQEKDKIEKYKQKELQKQVNPLKKVRNYCESPTSLQRRRALEQTDTSSSSEASEGGCIKGPKVPFDKLLKGVIAYVEVRRDNVDRSEGIEAVMRLMGATIREKFTNDVTHVVFKDGSFTTFEKAKLMKKHLVSVLWLDAIRRNNVRVPEKNYPAFGNRVCDANVSLLCSQIQKDYEEIIQDEKRRRHTIGPQTSMSSYITAQNVNNSDEEPTDKSPELTSDDSDCGVIDGFVTKRRRNPDILTETNSLVTEENSTSSISLLPGLRRENRKTINIITDMILTPNNEKASNPQTSSMSSLRLSESDKTKSDLHNSKDTSKTKSSLYAGKENSIRTSMSSLRLSEASKKSSEKIISMTPEETRQKPLRAPNSAWKSFSELVSSAEKTKKQMEDDSDEENINEILDSARKPKSKKRSKATRKSRRITINVSESELEESFLGKPNEKTEGVVNSEPEVSPPKITKTSSDSVRRSRRASKQLFEPKKTRKLYKPDEPPIAQSTDEEEREQHMLAKSQKSPDGVFLNPNQISSAPPKRKVAKNESQASRRSQRLTSSQSKSNLSDSSSSVSLPITPIKRRSTLDFAPLTQSQQKRKLKLDPKRVTSIVCTKMHRHEVVAFEKTVINLGKFFVEEKVTSKTTHLVAGEAKRTINMLRAIARGCWILRHDWLLKSQELGRWVNEEDYELTEFSPAVQQCRLQREAFGSLYSMDLFKDCGPIYVANATTPKAAELKELISICKGKVTSVYRNAAVSVGEIIHRDDVTCVNEMWVLDSIHFNKLKGFKNYLLQGSSQNKSPEY